MSLVKKRSVTISGHRTSYSLEQPFYDELVALASGRRLPIATLIAEIDAGRPRGTNLSSAIRIYILDQIKRARSG